MPLAAGSGQGSIWPTILMFALLFGLMYVMFIRPQAKRRKDAENMQKQLGAGDKIITIGGLHGSVVAVDDDTVTVEIAPGVNARFARAAVARVVEQTTVPAEHVVDSATDGDAKP